MGRLFDEFGISDEDFRLTLKPTLYEEFGVETPALEVDQPQTQAGPPPRWGGKTTDDFVIDPMLRGFRNQVEKVHLLPIACTCGEVRRGRRKEPVEL